MRLTRWCRLLMLYVLIAFISGTCIASSGSFNPYSVLGLKKEASQDEIKRQYRTLCLKYHPDKNVQKSPKERKKCEEMFKNIQKANELIGTDDARRRYSDMQAYSSSFEGPQGSSQYSNSGETTTSEDLYQELYRRYYQQRPRPSTTAFYFNGVDISNVFPRGAPAFWTPRTSMKSRYIQKVKVPLEYLYSGKRDVEIPLQDYVWNRYAAAFRGGFAGALLYESLFVSLSLIRMVRFPWSFLVGAVFFHFSLPRPTKLEYVVDLQAGWKEGTKLKFNGVERGFDVVFVLQEEKHPRYRRVGNDLHTFAVIDKRQARRGCTVKLDSLDTRAGPTVVTLEANQVQKSGDQVRVHGLGWPGRKGKPSGDLLISFKVVRRAQR